VKLFPGDIIRAIAAYNGGVKHADGTYSNPDYVAAVTAIWNRIRRAALPVGLVLALGLVLFLYLRGRH
jgi:soluble lytic murein transglycosylase-like protein